jgi:hypothetical protein
VNLTTHNGGTRIDTEDDEGPGLLSSVTFWLVGPVVAVIGWTAFWIGLVHVLEYFTGA